MIALSHWCSALNALDDKRVYTLHELQLFLTEFGHRVEKQAIYRWIRRRNVPSQGTINLPHSKQNLICWLGCDLRSALQSRVPE
jgi:hypothetical protein